MSFGVVLEGRKVLVDIQGRKVLVDILGKYPETVPGMAEKTGHPMMN